MTGKGSRVTTWFDLCGDVAYRDHLVLDALMGCS